MTNPPTCEAARLAALHALAVLDTPAEPAYDDLTRLAARLCGAPIALVSLVDADRQWFKSRHGLTAAETPRSQSFCAHALHGPDLFVVPDATADPRFRDNPLVTGGPGIRFYAGMPLVLPDGHPVGTLCVIDRRPRGLSAQQADDLRALGRQVLAQLVLRRQVADLHEAEDRFRAYMDHSPAVSYMKDEAGRFVYVNETLRRRFGVAGDGWLGRSDHDLFPAEFADDFRRHDRQVLAGHRPVLYTERTPGPDGPVFWRSYKFPFVDGAGRRFLAGMSVDVTAETRAEADLRASEARFRGTLDRLAEGVYLVDAATGRAVEANAAVLAMLGYTAGEFPALDLFELVANEDRAGYERNVADMLAALARDGRADVGRKWFRRKDGTAVRVDVKVSAVPGGAAGLHAVVVRDVTAEAEAEDRLWAYQADLEEANARLKALAVTDGLTGVRNRPGFDARLADECDRAARTGRPLSVLVVDVDHFKLFNDSFGHPAGDAALRAVAAALQRTARTTDCVARYGGEEFALVLPDTDHAGALVLAERCRRAVAALPSELRPVTVSVGAATAHGGSADPRGLVRDADAALYRSKQAGRNRVTHGSGAVPMAATVRG